MSHTLDRLDTVWGRIDRRPATRRFVARLARHRLLECDGLKELAERL